MPCVGVVGTLHNPWSIEGVVESGKPAPISSRLTGEKYFGLIPDDELAGQGALFRPNAERVREEILSELRSGPRTAQLLLESSPLRLANMMVAEDYREFLLELEAEQCIEVLDGKPGAPTPAAKRPKRKGEPTLSERYNIRLRQ